MSDIEFQVDAALEAKRSEFEIIVQMDNEARAKLYAELDALAIDDHAGRREKEMAIYQLRHTPETVEQLMALQRPRMRYLLTLK